MKRCQRTLKVTQKDLLYIIHVWGACVGSTYIDKYIHRSLKTNFTFCKKTLGGRVGGLSIFGGLPVY